MNTKFAWMEQNTLEGIQVLRAIAAIMVVIQHAKHSVPGSEGWMSFGGTGVDIFFVISGYIMAHTTRGVKGGALDAGLFVRKRIARIVPLYWLAILWTARRNFGDPRLPQDMLFIPHDRAPIVVQGWTLNFEMAFYAIFTLCLLLPRYRLPALIIAIAMVPVAGLLIGGDFYANDVVLEFAFGVILFHTLVRFGIPNWSRWTFLALMALGFGMLALGWDSGPRSLLVGLPALLIVWASFKGCEGWLAPAMPQAATVALLANASYAIYLFHWASFGAVKPLGLLIHQSDLLMIAHILMAIVSGCLIHLLVEKRLTRYANWLFGLGQKKERQSNWSVEQKGAGGRN